MLGRAGRPQFDRSGVGEFRSVLPRGRVLRLTHEGESAVIMTERESQQRYENLVNAQVRSNRDFEFAF